MFDVDEDDLISLNDLIDFYRMMYIDNYRELLEDNKLKDPFANKRLINDDVIEKMAKEMLKNFDFDGDKVLNLDEFKKVI